MASFVVAAVAGPGHPDKRVLELDESLEVGRAPDCGFSIADAELAGRHFRLAATSEGLRAEALGQATLLCTGEALRGASDPLPHAAWLRAGRSDFMVFRVRETAERMSAAREVSASARAARAALGGVGPLYAWVDVAPDPTRLLLLRETRARLLCMADEPDGALRAHHWTYLVALEDAPDALDTLIEFGWGEGWAAFLPWHKPPQQLRAHWKQALEGGPDDLRPSGLRAHLESCSARERSRFLGPLAGVWVEGDDMAPLRIDG